MSDTSPHQWVLGYLRRGEGRIPNTYTADYSLRHLMERGLVDVAEAHILLDEAIEPVPDGWWESIEPEIERRIRAIESGEEQTLSYKEVKQRIRERLDGKRDSVL
jgi:hypothetical protein